MTRDREFVGKVVVITGAGGGIGSATARLFAAEGATTVLVDRDTGPVEALAGEIGGEAAVLDLRDEDAIDHLVADLGDRHGRLDALVNIAGVFVGTEAKVEESVRKTWDLSLDVNLRATHHLTARAIPLLVESKGAVVMTSSTQARAADDAWASYGIAKAGVEALTRYVATQYGPQGVRCNCVAPGVTATERALARFPEERATAVRANTPLRRFGRPEELAEAYLFLASERSSFITGQVIPVDGGMMVHLPV
ncbi:NAD(P)-dependent dehydrogenase (short-subunit alcohol dehydrogenase family) [Nocardioides sp. BE266]|uniref:SDR family NAD(P)-dependent oxidoreductase n=1 Tax=Nocardioides sp. BE266 TaxID=2817725 RepID=UPI00285EC294|nr:SDR family oxidoreductase [Nocardioides sp. BE266]MDR7254232.1 NAD(P)-dependent dehydrogenase (short-subunit alcohol dehydrogenase family) [Nocardioides sp. BE266]